MIGLRTPVFRGNLTQDKIWIVWLHVMKEPTCILQKIAVQPPNLTRTGNLAGPDVQAARLLPMQLKFLEALLYPLPILLARVPS